MQSVSNRFCTFEVLEHPEAPVGGQRVDPRDGFDLGSVERQAGLRDVPAAR